MSVISESFEALKDYPTNEGYGNDMTNLNAKFPGMYSKQGNAKLRELSRPMNSNYNEFVKDYKKKPTDEVDKDYQIKSRHDSLAFRHKMKADTAKMMGKHTSARQHRELARKIKDKGRHDRGFI